MELIKSFSTRNLSDEQLDQLAALRHAVLAKLIELNADPESSENYAAFQVIRTNERKGYRDERPFSNDSPYQDEPKVRIAISLELDDSVLGEELVATIAALEAQS